MDESPVWLSGGHCEEGEFAVWRLEILEKSMFDRRAYYSGMAVAAVR